MRCRTTSRRSRRPCSPTASCSCPRRRASTAPRSSRTRSPRRRRSRRRAGVRSAIGCAALGVLLLVVAGTFDAEPLYVTGAALLLLGAGAAAWIAAGAWGAEIERELGGRSVLEEQPLSVVISARSGMLPLPPGWIDEPLLPEPVRFHAGRRST